MYTPVNPVLLYKSGVEGDRNYMCVFSWLTTRMFTQFETLYAQTTLFIPTLETTTKPVLMTIRLSRNLRLKGNNKSQIYKNTVFNTFKKRDLDNCRIASEAIP